MSYVDDYLADLDPDRRAVFEHIRRLVHEEVPDVEEGISYSMPTYKYRKKAVLGFLAAKNHLSLFPFGGEVITRMADRLAGFSLSSGTIRFSLDKQVPDDVVRDIVRWNIAQIEEKGATRS